MSPFRTLLSHHHSYSLLKPQNPLSISQITSKPFSFSSIFQRICSSHQTENQTKPRKSLDLVFKEAVELSPKPENSESEGETEDSPLKKSLMELEKEVKSLKSNSNGENKAKKSEVEPKNSKAKVSLYAVFTNKAAAGDERKWKELTRERSNVFKALSQDMEVVVSHLYKEGYFNDANFLSVNEGRLDYSCFNNSYGRGFVKFAVERFAKDNQVIAKWLSGSDLKKVALVGCPSLARKSVFGAKRLRKFFEIQEHTVCSKCVLKQSCNFVNQNVWNGGAKNLVLADVMNTITLYALDAVPPQLVVSDEVKSSVSRLLKEVLRLSKTTS
ncbi:uncharacterized protein Pyn_38564 [Prunus yedoensis var. nudiflora]|uniref:Uncharacterized protein n=1 Tax=Prunus yedoensis var. nudiflora TaxID=2094558 RepID=A0A314UWA3_PRUYE|nr:uncharacterized protein Pyn_38564 [Prunus yedoensis var. nudiflora]